MYLLELGAYIASAPKWLPFLLLFIIASVSVGFSFREGRSGEQRDTLPWEGLSIWLALSLWILAFQANVLSYGAQRTWYGDWFEHYERSLFFLNQLPLDTTFLQGNFSLPARGPIFNATAGLLMSGFGKEFWVYQCISTVLNAFPVIVMGLLIRETTGWSQNKALLCSAVFLGFAPFSVQQMTYTWTKFFAVGFILSGIYFYIQGCRQQRFHLVGFGFFAFSLGILAHYMVLIPMLFFLGHFLLRSLRNPKILKTQVMYLGVLIPLIFFTWFGSLFMTFGVETTLKANTAIGKEYGNSHNNLNLTQGEIFSGNMLTSIFPYSWRRNWEGLERGKPILKAGWNYGPKELSSEDKIANEFTEYRLEQVNNQCSLLGNLGLAGIAGLIVALMVIFRGKSASVFEGAQNDLGPGRIFWVLFVFLGIPLNILPVPIFMGVGASYAHLQIYVFLAGIWILGNFDIMTWKIKFSLIGLFLFESAVTNYNWILLHSRPVEFLMLDQNKLLITGSQGLNFQYVNNFLLKFHEKLVFLFDHFRGHTLTVLCIFSALSLMAFVYFKPRSS
jgi:hypothetical protein